MENSDKHLEEAIKRLHDTAADITQCNGCGHIFKPSKQEALEIVMEQFGEYLATKGMKKLAKMCAALGYTPAELGIEEVNYTFGGEKEGDNENGVLHRYEIFLKSGASRFVTADEVIYDEDIDDRTCDTIKTIQFLWDGRIVAQVDRETQFIVCEEKDGEDNK